MPVFLFFFIFGFFFILALIYIYIYIYFLWAKFLVLSRVEGRKTKTMDEGPGPARLGSCYVRAVR